MSEDVKLAAAPQASAAKHAGQEAKTLTAFLKAIKAVGLYPEGSPVPEKITGAFASELSSCFEQDDRVQITFRGEGIHVNGMALSVPSDDPFDLPVALFEIGLRDLTFLPEVTPPELYALVRLLARAARRELNPAEEDLSVLLWEMDLPGITYRVVEVGDESEAALSFEAAEPGEGDAEVKEMWDSLHPLERYIQEHAAPQTDNPPQAAVAYVGEAELEALRRSAKREPIGMGRKFVLILLELIIHEVPQPEFERIKFLLPDYFLHLLALGQFRTYLWLAARLLERVHELSGNAARRINDIGVQILGEEAASQALAALRAGRCDDPQSAELVLCSLRTAGLVAVLTEAIEGHRAPGKASLKAIPPRVIERVLADRPDALLAQPDLLTSEQLRYVANVIQSSPGNVERWSERLLPLLDSEDPGVRKCSLEILTAVGTDDLEERLHAGLHDPEGQIRHFAVGKLSELFGEAAFDPIEAVIEGEEFRQKDFEEQATFYEALTIAAPERAFPILERTLRRRDWLAPKTWRQDKACALRGLGVAPAEKAVPLLMRYRKSRDWLLAEACREALARQHRRAREEGRTISDADPQAVADDGAHAGRSREEGADRVADVDRSDETSRELEAGHDDESVVAGEALGEGEDGKESRLQEAA